LTSVKAIKNDPARPKWQQLALTFNFRGRQAFGHSGRVSISIAQNKRPQRRDAHWADATALVMAKGAGKARPLNKSDKSDPHPHKHCR